MLTEIHVKNFALIEEATLPLGEGLNILTGETGAGKSILIDAVGAALGGKAGREFIGSSSDTALAELLFSVTAEEAETLKNDFDLSCDDGCVILSRRLTEGRSVCRVNGETVPVSRVKEIAQYLIDIHGQHEHQSLQKKQKHLQILDEYAGVECKTAKERMASSFKALKEAQKTLDSFEMGEDERLRELDFLRFQSNEIEEAALKKGEEESLSEDLKRLSNAEDILKGVAEAIGHIGYDSDESAGEQIGRGLNALSYISRFSPELKDFEQTLMDCDSILAGLARDMKDFMSHNEYDEEALRETEKRLDRIRNVQAKYGGTYDKVMISLANMQERISFLEEFAVRREKAEKTYLACKKEALANADALTTLRVRYAADLSKSIAEHLKDLNFLQTTFAMTVEPNAELSAGGHDTAEFRMSPNPGEPLKPLAETASGGELSRVMLAIKTVLANQDNIGTMIFDEIDTGISGRTAQAVSEKLNCIGMARQVICITHLPQIAAMADQHFRIEKSVTNGRTLTQIVPLDYEGSIEELARMLGGLSITDAVRYNAREMKELASSLKEKVN